MLNISVENAVIRFPERSEFYFAALTEVKSSPEGESWLSGLHEALILKTNPHDGKIKKREREREMMVCRRESLAYVSDETRMKCERGE